MRGHILMSAKEVNRVPVIKELVKGELKVRSAAERLGISTRQVMRLKARYLTNGVKGLIHKGRGRKSKRAIPKKIMEKALTIIRQKYYDFGPTLASEKLSENEGINLSRETLRKKMIEEGLWKSKKKRYVKIYQMRERRSREGELVQADGSPYAWFEGRGPYCNLLVFIDDATGKLKYLHFVYEETTNDYFRAMDSYINNHGKPLSLYVDRHSVFRTTRYRNGHLGVNDSLNETQFARAMRQLSIELICANTPQAKGRVEKVNATLQDRLTKELRLRGISTIKDGNRYLPSFIKEFNEKFPVKAKDGKDAHRPLLPSEHLKEILVKKDVRILSKNLTFQYKNRLYQINSDKAPYSMRHAQVGVREDWDGRTSAYYKGRKLNIRIVRRYPKLPVVNSKKLTVKVDNIVSKTHRKTIWKPPADHPWRRFVIS